MGNRLRRNASRNVFPQFFIPLLLVMLSFAVVSRGKGQSSPPVPPTSQAESPATPQKDSLADAARKARAKKGKFSPLKVYTDDDVSGNQGGSGVSVVGQQSGAGGSADAAKGDAGSQAGTKSGKSDEEFWRSKARRLHDQMAAVDQEIAKLQDDIRKNGSSGFDASSGLQQNVIYVDDKNARVQKLQNHKADLQKQLDQLQEEGRKAGAPAGWFR